MTLYDILFLNLKYSKVKKQKLSSNKRLNKKLLKYWLTFIAKSNFCKIEFVHTIYLHPFLSNFSFKMF